LRNYLEKIFPDSSKGKITNHTSQIWAFSHSIKSGDWVVLPSKHKSAIHIAKVKSSLNYDDTGGTDPEKKTGPRAGALIQNALNIP